MDLVNDIIAYEQGELSEQETIDLFKKLIITGMIYQLQGHYHRTAQNLIDNDLITI